MSNKKDVKSYWTFVGNFCKQTSNKQKNHEIFPWAFPKLENECCRLTRGDKWGFSWEILANVITRLPPRSCRVVHYLRSSWGSIMPPPTTEHVLFGSAVQCTTSAVYLGKDFIWGISYKVSHILFLCQFPWALCYFQLAHFYPHLHVNNDESERHLSKTENADAWGVGCHLKANNLFISFDHKPHLKVFCFAVTVSFWGVFFVFEMLITS